MRRVSFRTREVNVGLLQGSMTLRFYRVEGEVPETYREDFLDELTRNAFRELGPEREFGVGWVSPENFLDTGFDDGKIYHNQYLTLALRADRKAVDARLFRALFDRELARFRKEANRDKVRPSEKKEIRDRLRRKLLAEAQPVRRTWDVCWDVGTGRMYFFGTGDKLQDLFREQFVKTFHLDPVPLTVKARFEAAAGQALPPDLEDPGREFLTWLYWRTDQEGGRFELRKSGEVIVWVDDKMLFKDPADGPAQPGASARAEGRASGAKAASCSLAGGDPARAPEARAALAGGKRLSKVKLGLKRGEREWAFTIDGETLDLAALKLPALLTGQEDEKLYERLALLEEAAFVIDELFGEYAKARLSDHWEKKDRAWIHRWIRDGAPAGALEHGGARKIAAGGAARRARRPRADSRRGARNR